MVADRAEGDLVQLRTASMTFHDLPRNWTFTCDGCDTAAVCEFAFDPYNTDGDCLAEK